MFNIDIVINFIKESISNYEKDIEVLKEQDGSSLEKYKDEISLLKNDIKSIIDIDLDIIKEIIDESNKSEAEKKRLFGFIKSMRRLLELNRDKNTTFTLTDKQLADLSKMYDIFDEININSQESNKMREEEIQLNEQEIAKLKKVLSVLEDQNNDEFIRDITSIVKALNRFVDDEESKRRILYAIMKYNSYIYNNQMTNKTIPLNITRLKLDDVRALFKSFGYNFDELKDKQKEDILTYGDLTNMQEIFICLKNLNFPRFNLKKHGKKLAIILINSDQRTLTDIVNHSKSKGIYPEDLLSVIQALIEQTSQGNNNGKPKRKDPPGSDSSPIVQGKSKDYKANIDFLSALGFDVAEIVRKCGHAILINHMKLVNNYGKFLSYGLSFDQTPAGDLTHPAFTFLVSNNFDEIIDAFIESGPFGYEYIRSNMSRVSAITDAKDLAFYNIYASYMDEDHLGRKMIPEGPFVRDNGSKLRLRGEITRLSAKYRNVPYRGIQENNKKVLTMTIDPPVNNKDKFDQAVSEFSSNEIGYLTFTDDRLKDLDEYLDETKIRYNFDGVIISKLKVQRIFYILVQAGLDNLEDSLLYAITYNTIINQENFDKIKNIVKSRSK